jgi:hypothetical protein
LTFNSSANLDKWKESLEKAGVKFNNSDTSFYSTVDSDSDFSMSRSVSTTSIPNIQQNGERPQIPQRKPTQLSSQELSLPEHLRPQVEVVKNLVDSYVKILKKTFK